MKSNVKAGRLMGAFTPWLWMWFAWHTAAQPATFAYDPAGNPISVSPGVSLQPSITTPPQAELLQSNSFATFSVVASGAGLTYQWLSNGVPVIGATSDSLTIANLPLVGTNLGYFSVIVSNASGSVTSAPAALWADANGNGIPDWWELKYFGNLNQTALGDYDGDGVSNLDEYKEGTNPADATSFNPRLQVQSVHGAVSISPELPYYSKVQFVFLSAVPDPGHAFVGWGGAVSGTKPQITLLMDGHKTAVARFGLPLPVALDNSNLVWTTGGDAPWFGQAEVSYDGLGAAQSGPIVSYWDGSSFVGAQSWLQAVTNFYQTFQLSFWWNVSSRPPAGLSFSIDGTNYAKLSGEAVGWQYFQTNLLAGNHVLTWTYAKGPVDIPTGVPFLDSGWVDQVILGPTNTVMSLPILTIALTPTNTVLVSWPAPSTGFNLQQSASLANANWVNSTNPVSVIGSQNVVLVVPSANGQFYRLIFQ